MEHENIAYQQILATLRMRVAQAFRIEEDGIPCFSPGELVNLLFLMAGQWGSVGDYVVTVKALRLLLGDSLWAKPEAAMENPIPSTLVQ